MIIREAEARDISALEQVQAKGGAAHRDRVMRPLEMPLRTLVAEDDGEVVGYAFLLLAGTEYWTPRYVPQLIELHVREDRREHGYGTALIHAVEGYLRALGHPALYLAVDPDHNPRALALYRRLGYVSLGDVPVDEPWQYTDSAGVEHTGIDHVIYMRKDL